MRAPHTDGTCVRLPPRGGKGNPLGFLPQQPASQGSLRPPPDWTLRPLSPPRGPLSPAPCWTRDPFPVFSCTAHPPPCGRSSRAGVLGAESMAVFTAQGPPVPGTQWVPSVIHSTSGYSCCLVVIVTATVTLHPGCPCRGTGLTRCPLPQDSWAVCTLLPGTCWAPSSGFLPGLHTSANSRHLARWLALS